QPDQALHLRVFHAQELLGSGEDAHWIGFDLDLRHSLDIHRHTLVGVEILCRGDVKAHKLQAELAALLDHGPNDFTASLDDFCSTEAIDDQRLVRSDLAVQPGNESCKKQHHNDHDAHNDQD